MFFLIKVTDVKVADIKMTDVKAEAEGMVQNA